MQKLIEEKIEILKKANKFNLVDITNEEIGEFREARFEYQMAIEESRDKKYIQRKFEAMLDEIADVKVTTQQWDDLCKMWELLELEEMRYIGEIMNEHRDYINSVMLYKMERTILRNKVDWYKK